MTFYKDFNEGGVILRNIVFCGEHSENIPRTFTPTYYKTYVNIYKSKSSILSNCIFEKWSH
jgi:hypothetical protein